MSCAGIESVEVSELTPYGDYVVISSSASPPSPMYISGQPTAIGSLCFLNVHSNSPYPGSLGPGTVRNSEMPVTKNS